MMKLIFFIAVILFKCSRLSSAPADASSSTDTSDIKDDNENDYVSNQPSYLVGEQPALSYVSNEDGAGTTGVVFQFRRSIKSDNTEIEARRRSALDKGFMRFGRGGSGNMLRFGRSPSEYDEPDSRIRKNDKNMMRFGRSNMMRFGRSYSDDSDPEYNDAGEVEDFIEHPAMRSPDNRYDEHGNRILRLGRSSSESMSNEAPDESFEIQPRDLAEPNSNGNTKKSEEKNMMRFGRGNMMRLGRTNPMRFGKRANMMRFGRDSTQYGAGLWPFTVQRRSKSNDRNLIRLGRGGNLIRFGRNDKNLMRFGKRNGPQATSTSTKIYCEDDDCVVQKNENQLTDNPSPTADQLKELFGSDATKHSYGEYIIEK